MEKKIQKTDHVRNVTGIVKNLKTVFSKQSTLPLKAPKDFIETNFYTPLPEHKAQAQEAELKKARVLAEAHRRRMQIL